MWYNFDRKSRDSHALTLTGVALFSGGNLSPGNLSPGNLSPGVRKDRANRWVIAVFGLIGLLEACLPAYTDRKRFWTLDGDTIRWVGVALFAAGGALRLWPVFVLGRRFSGLVAIQLGHTLVTTGIYGVIRHPSYLGLLVNSLGWALAFRSGSACFSQRRLFRHCWRAFVPKSDCCARSSAASTKLTVVARRG
jgi:hypothetical protein